MLFPSTATQRHALNRQSFFDDMCAHAPDHRWIRTPGERTVTYASFSRRISEAIDAKLTYAQAAEIAHPLISFYWRITEKPELATVREQAATFARYTQRSFLDGLSREISPRQVAFVALDNAHLDCIDKPSEQADPDIFLRWRALCVNGKTDLYRSSLTLYRLKHQLFLNTKKTELPVLQVGVLLARTCITYADYMAALELASLIRKGYSPKLEHDRLLECLHADRVFADASCFLSFRKSREEIDALFKEALARLNNVRKKGGDLSEAERFALQRDLMSVWVRSLARARLFESRSDTFEANIEPRLDDRSLLVDLADSIEFLEKAGFRDHPTLGSRFVHYDSLARGLSMLLPAPEGIEKAKTFLKKMESCSPFAEDLKEQEILTALGESQYIRVHREYRSLSTQAMIACQEAAQEGRTSPKRAEILKRANGHLDKIVSMITVANMYHTRLEIELLKAKIMQLGS